MEKKRKPNPDMETTNKMNAIERTIMKDAEANSMAFSSCQPISPENKVKNAQKNAIFQLEKSYQTLVSVSAIRLEAKLSNTRVSGVARELKELIKVMSVYA